MMMITFHAILEKAGQHAVSTENIDLQILKQGLASAKGSEGRGPSTELRSKASRPETDLRKKELL